MNTDDERLIADCEERCELNNHAIIPRLLRPLLEEASNLCCWQSDGDMIADLELLAKWATQTLDGERKELAKKHNAQPLA